MISARGPIGREAVASHYDELDYFYRDVWGDHVHHGLWLRGDETREEAVLQLVDLVAREARVSEGRASARPDSERRASARPRSITPRNLDVPKHVPPRVCDIGCGYGATSRLLAARGAHVTAMTISPAQFAVALARQPENSNPQFLLGDWLENDLPAESFDAAIAIESSEHMPDIGKFFQQVCRVLRPGGRLVVCAWLTAERPGRLARRGLLESICREGRMPQMGSATDYQRLGERAGLKLAQFEDVTRAVSRTWPAIIRRLLGKFVTKPRYLKFLVNRHAQNRVFALTIPRIWLAYRVGAMRYGIFTFVK